MCYIVIIIVISFSSTIKYYSYIFIFQLHCVMHTFFNQFFTVNGKKVTVVTGRGGGRESRVAAGVIGIVLMSL